MPSIGLGDWKKFDQAIQEGYDTAHRTGIIGQVFRTGRTLFAPDVAHHPLYDPFDPAITWELCFPVCAEGRLVAVVNLEGAGTLDIDQATVIRKGRLQPFSLEAIKAAFAGVPRDEVALMLGGLLGGAFFSFAPAGSVVGASSRCSRGRAAG